MSLPANRCRDLFSSPAGPRCELPAGHHGPHAAHVLWGAHLAEDAPTAKLPPIRDTVRRRPPAPEVRELVDRAELLEAMGRELQRELRELLDVPGDDEDDE